MAESTGEEIRKLIRRATRPKQDIKQSAAGQHKLDLAHEAVAVEDLRKVLMRDRIRNDAKTIKDPDTGVLYKEMPSPKEMDDLMGDFRVGDEFHIHVGDSPDPQPVKQAKRDKPKPPPAPPAQPPAVNGKEPMTPLQKAALAAAVAGGLSIPPSAAYLLRPNSQPPAAVDTDTIAVLEVDE